MSSEEWVDYQSGTDLYGRTVRVLYEDGQELAVGIATAPFPVQHPEFPDIFGIPLGVDPDGPGLDDGIRQVARDARVRMLGADPAGWVEPDGQATLVEIISEVPAGCSLQYQNTEGVYA